MPKYLTIKNFTKDDFKKYDESYKSYVELSNALGIKPTVRTEWRRTILVSAFALEEKKNKNTLEKVRREFEKVKNKMEGLTS